MPLSKAMIETILMLCNITFGTPEKSMITAKETMCRAQLIACYVDDRKPGTFNEVCVGPILKEIAENDKIL